MPVQEENDGIDQSEIFVRQLKTDESTQSTMYGL